MPLQQQDLINKLQCGDEEAFKQLYNSYIDRVYNVCYRFFGSRAEAEDAVQEIFCKIFLSITKFRGDAQLTSWIYRIAVNYCLNALRRTRRMKLFSLENLSQDNNKVLSSAVDDPQEKIEKDESEYLVQKAINSLSVKQRSALILYRYEGLSYQEIAKILDCSVTTVESRLHQAKKNLAKKLLPLLKEL